MTSPFLPILTNPPNAVLGAADSGKSSLGIGSSGQGHGSVTFSDVLGGTQQLLQENDQPSFTPFDDQSPLWETILNNQEILDELVAQGLILIEQHGPFSFQLAQAGSTKGLPIQHFLDVRSSAQTTSVNTDIQGNGGGLVAQVQAILNRLQSLESTAGQILSSIPRNRAHLVAEPNTDSSLPVQLLTRLNENVGTVSQAVDGEALRVRPLLNELSQSSLDARPSSVAVGSALLDSTLNVQRLLTTVEGTAVNPQTIVETLAGGTRIPTSQDDLTQGLTRVEGESKLLGTLGASQSTESHSGHSGTGLPFGQHPGTGQGQVFDSTPSHLLSTHQGQTVAKGGSFDERLQLLNTAVPHRLQIDVQLSESSRVQVDVGVAQRQVYAGVLLDNPVLRALASQNVQSLEAQLEQAEMELEEFDVHEENQHLHEQSGRESLSQHGHEGGFVGNLGDSSDSHKLGHSRATMLHDTGWHLVA